MPRAKHPASYPPQFSALMTQGANPNFHVLLTYTTKNEAERIRSSWYGFLKALDRTRPEDAEQARAISCRMFEDNGQWIVEFRNRASDPVFAKLNTIPFFTLSPTINRPEQTNSPLEPSIPFEDVFENMLARDLASKQAKPDIADKPAPEDSAPTSPLTFDED